MSQAYVGLGKRADVAWIQLMENRFAISFHDFIMSRTWKLKDIKAYGTINDKGMVIIQKARAVERYHYKLLNTEFNGWPL